MDGVLHKDRLRSQLSRDGRVAFLDGEVRRDDDVAHNSTKPNHRLKRDQDLTLIVLAEKQ
jgi:hypothetical protein